jgi:alpha-amylase/alpha-mannosidase (GH57 family)
MSLLPLRIAILWHQHQPYYKKHDEFIMPWVRLHAAKDYYDLPAIAREFPGLKQTFNLVPSLLRQIDEYIAGDVQDRIQKLTLVPAAKLTLHEKKEILRLFFLCNPEMMIAPYERYRELKELFEISKDDAHERFTEQDWTDLQVWYNLTWTGELSRGESPELQDLFRRQRGFTEQDKDIVLRAHQQIMQATIPLMDALHKANNIDLSFTPYYHPILPLLINASDAHQAMPGCALPDPAPDSIADANQHIDKALALAKDVFALQPKGMWPAEGSVSNQALKLFAEKGIQWVATDEHVLFASPGQHHWTDKYFPHKVITESGPITCFFRDHALSDAVGFVYSRWNAADAANDFCNRLYSIRDAIIAQHGEQALQYAVVPVILDGENCWEYYAHNGLPFLRELYARLTRGNDFQTVFFGDAVDSASFLPALYDVRAGSWINADFHIWIGHPEDNAAWEMIAHARHALMNSGLHKDSPAFQKAYEHLLIAQGSDWFWWYGDEHVSANQAEFDQLFRWNIAMIYSAAGLPVPPETSHTLLGYARRIPEMHGEQALMHTLFKGEYSGAAIHSVTELLRAVRVYTGPDKYTGMLELQLNGPMISPPCAIKVCLWPGAKKDAECIKMEWTQHSLSFNGHIPRKTGTGINRLHFSLPSGYERFGIRIETHSPAGILVYPRYEEFKVFDI